MRAQWIVSIAAALAFGGALLAPSPLRAEPPVEMFCEGDSDHHEHSFSTTTCYDFYGRHYPKDIEPDKPCSHKARHCQACYDCCGQVTEQTKQCDCTATGPGSRTCNAYADYANQACRDNCFGTYLDGCA